MLTASIFCLRTREPPVTLTNDSFGPVSITGISVGPTPTFAQTNTCLARATLNPGQSCPIYVRFSPPDSILYTGSLRVSYNGKGQPAVYNTYRDWNRLDYQPPLVASAGQEPSRGSNSPA